MKLIDSHVHISKFDNIDVIKRAKNNGVEKIIGVSTNLDSSINTLEWAEKFPDFIYPAIGIHPNNIHETTLELLTELIKENIDKIVAIGEIGLDYKWVDEMETREKQKKIFEKRLNLSKEYELPVSVHSRMAYRDALDLAVKNGSENIIFHWYDGPLDILDEILEKGYLISTTPTIEISDTHTAVIQETPLNRLLMETDSPVYIRKYKKTAEPADVTITAKALAKIKNKKIKEIAETTFNNAKKIFSINN
jgi:TatD DNase family protein